MYDWASWAVHLSGLMSAGRQVKFGWNRGPRCIAHWSQAGPLIGVDVRKRAHKEKKYEAIWAWAVWAHLLSKSYAGRPMEWMMWPIIDRQTDGAIYWAMVHRTAHDAWEKYGPMIISPWRMREVWAQSECGQIYQAMGGRPMVSTIASWAHLMGCRYVDRPMSRGLKYWPNTYLLGRPHYWA